MATKFNEIGEFGEPWFRGSSHGSVVCVAKIRPVGWKPARWSAETYAYTAALEDGGELVAESIPSAAIQGRIVACVNAMRGIQHPARFMHELISCAHARTTAEFESAIETLRQMLSDVVTIPPVKQIAEEGPHLAAAGTNLAEEGTNL